MKVLRRKRTGLAAVRIFCSASAYVGWIGLLAEESLMDALSVVFRMEPERKKGVRKNRTPVVPGDFPEFYFTTRFTIRFGTQIALTSCLPSMAFCTCGLARASSRIVSGSAPVGIIMRTRGLP